MEPFFPQNTISFTGTFHKKPSVSTTRTQLSRLFPAERSLPCDWSRCTPAFEEHLTQQAKTVDVESHDRQAVSRSKEEVCEEGWFYKRFWHFWA
ncbi:MAG: hypothetical protein F4203_05940 [Rhodobacteraceae bacterium]|nr:hypothetical protein [Paracoccaceae bacterium]